MLLFPLALALSAGGISLTVSNTVHLAGPVTEDSVRRWTRELALKTESPVYLYIDSPGGSVVAGSAFINAIEHQAAAQQKIVCIAEFAASMAFTILLACPRRVAMHHSIGMQHQMSLFVMGNLKSVQSRMLLAEAMERAMVKAQCDKLDMTAEEFREKTRDDWWLYGAELLGSGAVDDIATVGCAPSMAGKSSKCPLTAEPVEMMSGAGLCLPLRYVEQDRGPPTVWHARLCPT
jgi:ATP-dependent Clp protease protease subunit